MKPDRERLKESFGKLVDGCDVDTFNEIRYDVLTISELIDAALAEPSDADVDKIIATGEYLYGLNDDNLADFVIQTNEVQNYIVESFTALRQMRKPTDEKIRQAIGWQEAQKASAQNDWERAGAEWRMEPGAQEQHDERMASFDLAIQALRQMRQPTDPKILAALSWFEDMGNHEIVHRITQQPDYISTMPDTVIETIVTALRQMKPSEWIPVSDRLPTDDDADEKGNVLCYWTDEAIETYQARWIEEWNSDKNHKDKITHWRPLPAPPERSAG